MTRINDLVKLNTPIDQKYNFNDKSLDFNFHYDEKVVSSVKELSEAIMKILSPLIGPSVVPSVVHVHFINQEGRDRLQVDFYPDETLEELTNDILATIMEKEKVENELEERAESPASSESPSSESSRSESPETEEMD